MVERLEVALIQTRTPATAAAGLAHVEPLIRQAAAGGAQMILTPEGTNFLEQRRGLRDAALSTEHADAAVLGLRALAAELGVWLLIGSAIVRSDAPGDARAANRSLLIDPTGAITARYDKLHVFDVDLANGETYRESASVRPGEAARLADTPWGGLGLTICYDVRFPHLHRQLAPAQGGTHEDGRQTWGRSLIIGPWGEVIARADHDEPGVLHASLDLSAVERARASIPALRHDREFDPPQ